MATSRITTLDDPALAPFRAQKEQWLRARHRPDAETYTTRTGLPPDLPGDLFIAEGIELLGRLIQSPHEVHAVLVADNRLEAVRPLIGRLHPSVPIHLGTREQLGSIVGFDLHRGVLACGRRGRPPTVDELIESHDTLVMLEDLTNHDNVGSIFRSIRALAGDANPGVLCSPRCCDPLYRKSLRVSMGQALFVPFATADDWPATIERVARDRALLALDPGDGSVPIRDAAGRAHEGSPPRRRVAILVGTEGPGLDERTKKLVRSAGGRLARIEIDDRADSLNVSTAAAIALHEIRVARAAGIR
ncbi:MAG: RNA methyltransferase [Planctomycetota bacterium]